MSLRSPRQAFIPPVEGGRGVRYTGWQEPLSRLVERFAAAVEGIAQAVESPDIETSCWPRCVPTEKFFPPEESAELVDTAQSSLVAKKLCNFIARSGKTYRMALKWPGPGVFVGRYLKCAMYMKFHNPDANDDFWFPLVNDAQPFLNNFFTTRFSVFPTQPNPGVLAPSFLYGQAPALNYAWNINDPRTGRNYANDLLSGQFMKPQSWMPTGTALPFTLPDGDFFDLRRPYVLERDAQLTMMWRPLTDFLQFDSSLSGQAIGLSFDDRVNGKRDQTLRVAFELHGVAFETMQDAVHSGALTHRW